MLDEMESTAKNLPDRVEIRRSFCKLKGSLEDNLLRPVVA
jgi:hypothetical protein